MKIWKIKTWKFHKRNKTENVISPPVLFEDAQKFAKTCSIHTSFCFGSCGYTSGPPIPNRGFFNGRCSWLGKAAIFLRNVELWDRLPVLCNTHRNCDYFLVKVENRHDVGSDWGNFEAFICRWYTLTDLSTVLSQKPPFSKPKIYEVEHRVKLRKRGKIYLTAEAALFADFMFRMASRGAFIVFEGCDRCGKTTQCTKLVEALNKDGISARMWRFPGIITHLFYRIRLRLIAIDSLGTNRNGLHKPAILCFNAFVPYKDSQNAKYYPWCTSVMAAVVSQKFSNLFSLIMSFGEFVMKQNFREC